MLEQGSQFNPEKEERLSNEDEIMRILAVGTEEERKELQDYRNVPEEQMRFFITNAELRHTTIAEMRVAQEAREWDNPEKTSEEEEMGVYWEEIEPHVRDAVKTLRDKGYDTHGSGFWGPTGGQRIYFHGEPLSGFEFPEDFVAELKEEGIELVREGDAVSFTPSRAMTLKELEDVWNRIVDYMPVVGSQKK